MSASFEAPMQFERDLRSASKDSKRSKDSTAKWAYGKRPLAGVTYTWDGELVSGGNETHRTKTRPSTRRSEGITCPKGLKPAHNINKLNHHSYTVPAGRHRSYASAQEELKDGSQSIIDLLPAATSTNSADGFLYSYDRTDSPPHVLSLDVFVKPNVPNTEKLVEKEYEILDGNGDALKGKKARQTLRKSASTEAAIAPVTVVEDDDFELV